MGIRDLVSGINITSRIRNAGLDIMAVCRKDQSAQVSSPPGVWGVPHPVQSKILRLQSGKNVTRPIITSVKFRREI